MKLPSPEQLKAIQLKLGKTQSEMAGLVGYLPSVEARDGAMVPDSAKWRKLTSPTKSRSHRGISYASLFHLATNLALSESELERVQDKMLEITSEGVKALDALNNRNR